MTKKGLKRPQHITALVREAAEAQCGVQRCGEQECCLVVKIVFLEGGEDIPEAAAGVLVDDLVLLLKNSVALTDSRSPSDRTGTARSAMDNRGGSDTGESSRGSDTVGSDRRSSTVDLRAVRGMRSAWSDVRSGVRSSGAARGVVRVRPMGHTAGQRRGDSSSYAVCRRDIAGGRRWLLSCRMAVWSSPSPIPAAWWLRVCILPEERGRKRLARSRCDSSISVDGVVRLELAEGRRPDSTRLVQQGVSKIGENSACICGVEA